MGIRIVACISHIYGMLCINEGLLKLLWNSSSFVEFKENVIIINRQGEMPIKKKKKERVWKDNRVRSITY